jgi:hypothetical protein
MQSGAVVCSERPSIFLLQRWSGRMSASGRELKGSAQVNVFRDALNAGDSRAMGKSDCE